MLAKQALRVLQPTGLPVQHWMKIHMSMPLTSRQSRSVAVNARRSLSKALQELENERQEDAMEAAAPVVSDSAALTWDRPLRVITYPDPRLRATNASIEVFDDTLKQLAQDMLEVMYQDDGVGLAAPQVGVNIRMMVFNPEGERGKGEEVVLLNPKIISSSKSTDIENEGCLSFPGIRGDVQRSLKVKIKAQDLKGKKFQLTLEGWVARIFQHEYDHLQGTLFHDRMQPLVVQEVRDQLVALEDAYLQQYPNASIRRVK